MATKKKTVKAKNDIPLLCRLGFHKYDYNARPVYCIRCGKIK